MAESTREREIISYLDSMNIDLGDVRQIIQEDLSLGNNGVAESLISMENHIAFVQRKMRSREDEHGRT